MTGAGLNWFGIFRLGLVQTALGAVVVLTTSTLNRAMVVELALPAMLPGILVGLHHAVQMSRPRWGFGADMGGRRTPWIIGGTALLALGGVGAAAATALMATDLTLGIVAALVAFLAIGIGVGAAGTSLLTLLAGEVTPQRRPAAATIVWLMMIAGFAVTAGVAGQLLDPFSPARLVAVAAGVGIFSFVLATVAVWGIERPRAPTPPGPVPDFRAAMAEIWAETPAQRFTVFVFVSMLAYSAQDLILEPFAGEIFGRTIGQSTSLAGLQNAGVLTGMLLVALVGTGLGEVRGGSLRAWTIAGCLASGVMLVLLALAGPLRAGDWSLPGLFFGLGAANGVFAAAAIARMMQLAGAGRSGREGTRMGLWGAAQAIAFGLGGFAGTVVSDVARWLTGSPVAAYASVFTIEAVLFFASALLAARIGAAATDRSPPALPALATPTP